MNVYDLSFDHEGLAFIDERQAKELQHVTVEQNDVLLNITGASVARCCLAPHDLAGARVNQHVTILRPHPDMLDGRFLAYVMVSPSVKALLLSLSRVGGTREALTKGGLERFEVPVPPLPIQRRIASILGAYDDLIEVNRRRIAVLEEMARRLFDEWFVHFRFPGHEGHRMVETEHGRLPEGWARRTLGELADDVSYGFTASAAPDGDGPRFLRITDIVGGPINWNSVPRCEIPDHKSERFRLENGDIVVARTGATTGWARRIGRQKEAAVFASYLVRFRFSKKLDPTIAATFMESDDYKAFVQGRLGGAAQPNANAKILATAIIVVPPPVVQTAFSASLKPAYDHIDTLVAQNVLLAASRDLLLPRLISGELSVTEAERELDAAA